MSKEKQIEEMACKNCIHYQKCVDTFRKAKQDGEILLLEEEAYFAKADGCDFYADKRIYRKQIEGEWIDKPTGAYGRMQSWCSACGKHSGIGGIESNRHKPFCPNCGAKMKGGE